MRPASLTRTRYAFGVVVMLLPAAATAQEHLADMADRPVTAAHTPAFGGRLDVRTALAVHDRAQAANATRINSTGSAVSHAALAFSLFPRRTGLGLALQVAVDRFGLRGEMGPGRPIALTATGVDGGGGLAARWVSDGGALALEGQVGYGFARLPVVSVGAGGMPPAIATLNAHGPIVGAGFLTGLGDWWTVEASGRVMPRSLGARQSGPSGAGASIGLRQYAVSAGIGLGKIEAGAVRLSALVGYELDATSASGGTADVSQLQHRVGLGLRAAFLAPPRPRTVAQVTVEPRRPDPEVAAPAVPAVPAGVRGRLRGLVRAAARDPLSPPGATLAGVNVEVTGMPSVQTGADGAFTLDNLPPGLVTLRLTGPGLADAEEVISIPAEGETPVELLMHPAAAPATLTGLVRNESGAPLPATLQVLELGVVAKAGRDGQFRLELPAGRYTLVIEAAGFAGQRKMVHVAAGEQSIYNVDLQRGR